MDARLTLVPAEAGPVIPAALHGQFVEHLGRGVYDGIWVGEASSVPNTRGLRNDVIDALRRLHVPVLRWPGGCFADEYDWRDGIGPREQRPPRINASWGGVTETNAFGTHEFMDLAELIGAAAYVNGNVRGGDAGLLADWVAYLTSDSDSAFAAQRRRNGRDRPWSVPYVGFGNEPWGCGGGMQPQHYADEYRRFAAALPGTGAGQYWRVAAGASGDDPGWTDVLMQHAGDQFDALSVHQYTLPTGDWNRKGAATGFDESEWASTLAAALEIDSVLGAHEKIMDGHDPGRRVALVLDEWGTWYDPEPGTPPSALSQQNSVRDALVAAITLNVLHAHADRVRMANIAQLVNVLQAMLLTRGDRLVMTPTYHAFEMYRPFQGATSIRAELEAPEWHAGAAPAAVPAPGAAPAATPASVATPASTVASMPALHVSAALGAMGRLHVALVNLVPADVVTVRVRITGPVPGRVTGRVLTGPRIDSVNTFEQPNAVCPHRFDGWRAEPRGLAVELPPRSVTVLAIDLAGGPANAG